MPRRAFFCALFKGQGPGLVNVLWVGAPTHQHSSSTFTISGPWPLNFNSPDPWPLRYDETMLLVLTSSAFFTHAHTYQSHGVVRQGCCARRGSALSSEVGGAAVTASATEPPSAKPLRRGSSEAPPRLARSPLPSATSGAASASDAAEPPLPSAASGAASASAAAAVARRLPPRRLPPRRLPPRRLPPSGGCRRAEAAAEEAAAKQAAAEEAAGQCGRRRRRRWLPRR